MSPNQWTLEVKRMQAMASSQFNDGQAKAIVDFLNYDELHRKSLNKPVAQAVPSGTVASGAAVAGRQFYDTQGCANCHAIAGKGGTTGPSLSEVGKRLSRDQLTAVIQGMRTGKSSMPPLPAETTDPQAKELIDFLSSLNNAPLAQGAGAKNKPETQTDQGSKPAPAQAAVAGTLTASSRSETKLAAEATPSGTVAATGRQFYDAHGCATCHAISGKGGTSGPSLSDVGKRLSKDKLTEVIQGMRTGKSSMPPLPAQTTDPEAKELVDYLLTLSSEPQKQSAGIQKNPEPQKDQPSKSEIESRAGQKTKPTAESATSGNIAAGRQFYDKKGCANCHAISGKGGTSGPSLSDVGKRLSKDKLTEVIQGMRTGKSSMPPLPAETTDQQARDLTDFLASLSNASHKQNASAGKKLETGTDQKSKPQPGISLVPRPRDSQSQLSEGLARLRANDTNGPTALPGALLLLLIGVTAVLIGALVFRPSMTETPAGKILAFFALFILPLICAGMGTTYHIDRSKSTKFCLSCHEMEPFGKSLLVDGSGHLAAAHFQNHRVPADEACYTCHTNYAMFGGFRAKMHGLRHVYVHYLGKPPAPEAIRLYDPFNNRECLHCHLGARSFEQGAAHNADPYLLPAVKGNQVSCLSCHSNVHNVAELNKAKFWRGNP